MSAIADAARIVLQREHFDDLDAAIAMLGVHLRGTEPASPMLQTWAPADRSTENFVALSEGAGDEDAGLYNADLVATLEGRDAESVQITVRDDDQPTAGGSRGPAMRGTAGADRPRPRDPRDLEPRRVVCSVIEPVQRAPEPARPVYKSVPPPAFAFETDHSQSTILGQRTLKADLYSLVKVPRPGREPDLGRVINHLSRGEAIVDLPLAPQLSAPVAISVLVEQSLRLGPMALDVDVLVAALRSTLGESRVEVWGFHDGEHLVCGPGPAWTWTVDTWHSLTAPALLVIGPSGESHLSPPLSRRVAARSRSGRPTRLIVFGEPSALSAYTWSVDD